jgi:hypothetical protein
MPLGNTPFLRYAQRFASTDTIRVDVGGTAETLALNADPLQDYFWLGDGSTEDLCRLVRVALDLHSLLTGTTCALNTDFRLTCTTSAAASIDWGHAGTTIAPEVLGVPAGTTALQDLAVSNRIPKGIVRPGHWPRVDSRRRRKHLGGAAESASGLTYATTFGTTRDRHRLSWGLIPEDLALEEYAAATDHPFGTHESMMDALVLGYGAHYVPTEQDALTYEALHLEPPYPALEDQPHRDEHYLKRWHVEYRFIVDADYTSPTWVNAYSYALDGSGDYLDFGDTPVFDGATRCTWLWWQRIPTWPGSQRFVWAKRNSGFGAHCWHHSCEASRAMQFMIAPTASSAAWGTTPVNTYTEGVWQLCGLVYDGNLVGNAARLVPYLNGAAIGGLAYTGTIPAALTSGTTSALQFGGVQGATNAPAGNYDEPACWVGQAASAAQMLTYYNGGVPFDFRTGPLGTPTLYHRADGDVGGVATDYGSAGLNGVYQGNTARSAVVP